VQQLRQHLQGLMHDMTMHSYWQVCAARKLQPAAAIDAVDGSMSRLLLVGGVISVHQLQWAVLRRTADFQHVSCQLTTSAVNFAEQLQQLAATGQQCAWQYSTRRSSCS
jgi:putative NADH-flavin reductase